MSRDIDHVPEFTRFCEKETSLHLPRSNTSQQTQAWISSPAALSARRKHPRA